VWQTATVVNNIVYIGSSNGFFYALDALKGTQKWRYHTNGSLIWHYQTGGHILSTAAIASSVIYFGSDDHNLYALNETTSLLSWHYLAGGPVQSSPAVVVP
jgi:outer membrane protein assembly factor BamB